MAGFKFERDLPHQVEAVKSILRVFDGADAIPLPQRELATVANPVVAFEPDHRYCDNIFAVQKYNGIPDRGFYDCKKSSLGYRTLDIMMETGTGKTYTYTKTMFELHRELGIKKFVVVVPTLSIKAGTVNFLTAKATNEHFRQEYGARIHTYVVESQKSKKNKKTYMPQAVREFVEAYDDGNIHVLVINAGMINSDTMSKAFDVNLFDLFNTPFGAIAAVKPFTIIDEPHKFPKEGTTYANIQKFESQYILRFGATFNDSYHNLVYRLTAVDAFNQNLVKGVVAHVEEYKEGEGIYLKLVASNKDEVVFEYHHAGKKRRVTIAPKIECMSKLHEEMRDLYILNANQTKIVLSNGLELKKNQTINPYSYAESLQEKMIRQAIENHFKIEKELMTREVRIKPLTLFFIDDIEGYRSGNDIDGSLKVMFEQYAKAHIERLLNEVKDERYREYLEKSLQDISSIHGGYFSKDNTEKDEKIEKEINEILHDKEALLSVENPRRFIFSKWTLREGWDNPNVFQICKLRSSGSMTSKLQEVGRGLRLPVNEYMSRVKDETFDLHYFVDFTEKDFVKTLVDEINDKSGAFSIEEEPKKLTDDLIKKIVETYGIDEETLLERLDDEGAIKRNNDFKEGGFAKVKQFYPNAFTALQKDRVRNARDKKPKVHLRQGKYAELKALWERINQKVVLEYGIENESGFEALFEGCLLENLDAFEPQGVKTKKGSIVVDGESVYFKETESTEEKVLPISTMSYKVFLLELSKALHLNMHTLHRVFLKLRPKFDINDYLNRQTIRLIRMKFKTYLLSKSMDKFSISYKSVSNKIHPTALTDKDGSPYENIDALAFGVNFSEERVADNYLFEELFFDSKLEEENIKKEIEEVIVFSKIPKNSIKIPVAGGGTYSPDFAYVIRDKSGKKSLNLIVEAKGKNDEGKLSNEEKKKIAHAQKLFEYLSDEVKITFRKQLKNDDIVKIIKETRAD